MLGRNYLMDVLQAPRDANTLIVNTAVELAQTHFSIVVAGTHSGNCSTFNPPLQAGNVLFTGLTPQKFARKLSA